MSSNTKQQIREEVWSTLEDRGEARFPFPVEGRIPNFNGAERAAEHLTSIPPISEAECIKANPDSPQKPVRRHVLETNRTLLVPTPRLKSGFYELNGAEIPDDETSDAVTLRGMSSYGSTVPLERLRSVELIVTGCVAVSTEGGRIGKGEGYSDLEYAIMKEVGGDDVPVATTVHSLQVKDYVPTDPHDIVLDWIATPERCLETRTSLAKPEGVDWSLLSEQDLDEMPVLRNLRNASSGC
jgi:5-formyltetrahydrofolate cyclo-ligase